MTRLLVRCAAAALVALAAAGPASAKSTNHEPAKHESSKHKGKSTSHDVTVMTRNLYLGTDLFPLAVQPDLPSFEAAAAARFGIVQANDFPTRAKALAAEIARAKPDLVGLQEAAIWRKSPDGVKDGNATPATEVVYDSLALLMSELEALDANYAVAASRPWFDYEAPTALGFDIRLTQNDAILVRTGKRAKVRVRRAFSGGFATTLDIPTVVGLARSPRGWVGVDAKRSGRKFRFVTTHLEAFSPVVADAQMGELLAGPLQTGKRRAILVGDFNADPQNPGPNAYNTAIADGFASPVGRRATCCFAEDLRIPGGTLTSWIDHIVARPQVTAVRSSIVGSEPADRFGGLWPSDHAGIVATLRLK